MAANRDNWVPLNAVVGWNEGVGTKKDAADIAKGYIAKRFTASGASWYAVAPFLGGYFWEAQEGGQGKGYIESVIEALTEDPSKQYWFPTGDRAFRVMMRDGKPIGILLSQRESQEVFASGVPPLLPKSKMYPAQRKGTATMAVGMAMSGAGALYFISALTFYALVANPGPSVPAANFAEMPHAQWNRVANTKVTEIVSKLEFKDNDWNAVMRAHDVPGLQELKDKTQSLLDKVKENIEPMPVAEPDRFSNLDADPVPPPAGPQPEGAANDQTKVPPVAGSIEALKEEIAKKNAAQNANDVGQNGGADQITPAAETEGEKK
ncbi:hypothetical protein [Mesorhizobium sp. SP-1A]|uniref:hypothetical protein n=1 Tax=Mesorhizobium sp. SP-1A TaxID=3077840 RepID=UPI0028F6DF76|nr:hypothetical protein [Mesorhizobium sp. SP-1A]